MSVVRPKRRMRRIDLFILVAAVVAVTWIVATDSVSGWPVRVLLVAFLTFIFTRRPAEPERAGLRVNGADSGPKSASDTHS